MNLVKKWHCKESGSIINKNLFPKHSTNLNVSKKEEDCGCEKAETYTIEEQRKEVHNASSSALSGATFPVEGISFGNGAKVSSHHMKHKGGVHVQGIRVLILYIHPKVKLMVCG